MIARTTASTLAFAACTALALATASAPAAAEDTAAPAPAAEASPAPAAAAPLVEPGAPSKVKDAKVEHLVTEDSQVRIEETRVRGVTTKIVVVSKLPGVASYEIQPRNPALAPENDKAAGMRLFNFNFGH